MRTAVCCSSARAAKPSLPSSPSKKGPRPRWGRSKMRGSRSTQTVTTFTPSSMHTYLEVLVRNSPKVRVLNAPAVTHDAPMQFVTLGQREFCLPPNLECFSRFLSIARLAITGQFSTPHDGSSSFRVVPPMAFSAMHHIGQALESSDGRPSNVLSVCHCLKMPRIDARLLSTEVIQLQSFGHCSTDDLVCNPICHAHSPVVFHLTVPVCTETGRPQPTTIRNVHDMTHEAFPIGVIH